MTNERLTLLSGDVLEEEVELTLAELCRSCRAPAERVFELVEEGIIEPVGRNPAHWRFHGIHVRRAHCAFRLERDLGVNLAGAALALDLLEELESLRSRMAGFGD
ncbi:MAG: MerR family transcriptional regulator [Halieaceae bacterium]|nr:MerR family transcriptional regulator [Halieaceae bacterium]